MYVGMHQISIIMHAKLCIRKTSVYVGMDLCIRKLVLVIMAWSHGISVCFENVPYKALHSGKNGVWSSSQTMWNSFQTLVIITENLSFLYLWNPSCVHRIVPTYACSNSHTQAANHIRRPRVTLVNFFPKIEFCLFKRLYFSF